MSESRVKLYKAVKRIGRGNFGVVSLVESLEDGKLYVNKTLALDQLSEQEKKGAHQEVLMLQALRKHPLIVRYKESIRDEENLHIIMEYCDGGDLASRIRNAKHHFTEKDILIWFAQIALAIQFCHRYNIIHRDIKSQVHANQHTRPTHHRHAASTRPTHELQPDQIPFDYSGPRYSLPFRLLFPSPLTIPSLGLIRSSLSSFFCVLNIFLTGKGIVKLGDF
eukprot:1334080-Amorphochlora_amoeboformis.AAC.1